MSFKEDMDAYGKVAKMYTQKVADYRSFMMRNPKENVTQDQWIISTLITDLLVARGEIDKSYCERYNYQKELNQALFFFISFNEGGINIYVN